MRQTRFSGAYLPDVLRSSQDKAAIIICVSSTPYFIREEFLGTLLKRRDGMMNDYASDENMAVAAQSCRRFKSSNSLKRKFVDPSEGVSCRICDNWNGSKCIANSFDSVLTGLGRD